MRYVCEKDKCTGCGVCSVVCPRNAITIEKKIKSYNALIAEAKCSNCGACERICQVNHPVETVNPQKWYQGWSQNIKRRESGASGGVAGSISASFILKGGVVASCTFSQGEFCFSIVTSKKDVTRFSGSKYIKSNPESIYKKVLLYLKNDTPVLFIGLPCQVAAVKRFVPEKLQEKLYTIDLICHGTPSPSLLNIFLGQYNIKLKEVKNVSFRKNNCYRLCIDFRNIVPDGVIDRYLLSFLLGLSYTDNCYICQYARIERVADLTLGDSWGSNLPEKECRKGISLILCQTNKGQELINDNDLHLESVNLQRAIEYNDQLKKPSKEPRRRKWMFAALSKGIKFNICVMLSIPIKCIKQDIKSILMRFK